MTDHLFAMSMDEFVQIRFVVTQGCFGELVGFLAMSPRNEFVLDIVSVSALTVCRISES